VVCGAQRPGGKAYPAPVGATLPGGLKLERRKIRGVESNGMLCSAKELGLGVDHAGILELETKAPPGTPFLEAIPVADEQIIIDVSANRPDLLCHKGVARDLAVSLGGGATVKLSEIPGGWLEGWKVGRKNLPTVNLPTVVDGVQVRLEDPGAPPRSPSSVA
jgi:phenylalanyl-tRNA synthetase beta chain